MMMLKATVDDERHIACYSYRGNPQACYEQLTLSCKRCVYLAAAGEW